jgi:AcrR family transcriptional regulator
MKDQRDMSQQIYDCARLILEAEGPEAVTMRRVAKAVGITPMAIYHHFDNREQLLSSISDAEFAKLAEYAARLQANRKTRKDFAKVVDAYLDYAFERPHIFDYVFSRPRPDARKYPRDFRKRGSPTLSPVADRLRESMRKGELKPDDPLEVALQLWAHVHGFVALYRAGRFNLTEKQFRALYHRAVRRLFRGLKT